MAIEIGWQKSGRYKMCHTGQAIGIMSMNPPTYWTDLLITLDTISSAGGVESDLGADSYGGTTANWEECGSWARLNPSEDIIPLDAEVVFAAFQWNGQSNGRPEIIDTTTITFIDPLNREHYISSGEDIYKIDANVKSRGIDATTIVKEAGRGDYFVKGVPIFNSNVNLGSGWSLFVVYTHKTFQYSQVTFYAGEWNYTSGLTLEGFQTPLEGEFNTRFFITSVNGNGDYESEKLRFNGIDVYGPNNPLNNFFCGQVNDYLGNLSTIGSFGDKCAPPPTKPIGEKACFDLTNVDISYTMTNNQNRIDITYIPGIEWMFTNALALEIELNAANLKLTKFVDKKITVKGDILIYTIDIFNDGSAEALDVIFKDTIPEQTTLIADSIKVNGTTVNGDIESGINIPNIEPFGRSTVTFSVKIDDGVKTGEEILNGSNADYSFIPVIGEDKVFDSSESNIVDTIIFSDDVTITKAVDKNFTMKGDTLLYTFEINNLDSALELENSILIDTLPIGVSYIENTFNLNGINLNLSTFPKEIDLNDLNGQEVATLDFKVTVETTIGTLINSGDLKYTLSIKEEKLNRYIESNKVETVLIYPRLNIKKEVDKKYATKGDILSYILVVKNVGNIELENSIIKDTIPRGTAFINNSVRVNGVTTNENPEVGINISKIDINEVITIEFKVQINN